MIHLPPGFCSIRHFTNIDQLCLIFPLYREVLVTLQCVWQNWNRQWLRTIFSHLEVNTHFVSMEPTVSPWRSSSGFITDLSWPKYGLLSKGIVLPSYLWPQPRPLPRASTRCCMEAQQVRSGNWSSWKPREKQLSSVTSNGPWNRTLRFNTSALCFGRAALEVAEGEMNERSRGSAVCACSTQAGWAKALPCTEGLGSPLPERPRAHLQSALECACPCAQSAGTQAWAWLAAPVRGAPVACWSGGEVWGLVALCLGWNGKERPPFTCSALPPDPPSASAHQNCCAMLCCPVSNNAMLPITPHLPFSCTSNPYFLLCHKVP